LRLLKSYVALMSRYFEEAPYKFVNYVTAKYDAPDLIELDNYTQEL